MVNKISQTHIDLIIFGGTGDLATRKLLPALYNLFIYNNITENTRIFLIGRKEFTKESFLKFALEKITTNNIDNNLLRWKEFAKLIHYLQIDINDEKSFEKLKKSINKHSECIYYLSTSPKLFKNICKNLAKFNLNTKTSRIILEKPLGFNLQSAIEINNFISTFFSEEQIFRIDHYLGKESVQNLLAIRFGNTLFEALWRRQWINNIQITIAEDIGMESRGEFYDQTGALKDMLQNHLLQLLCIVAMEPPYSLDSHAVRTEKLKVLQSLKPLSEDDVINNVIRGQYKSGTINSEKVVGYREEIAVLPNSNTETFVSLKAEIQNWRWSGVPFFLRTGKRLHKKLAEIVIQFKEIPVKIFPLQSNNINNRLIINLQPDESVQLYFLAKKPGEANILQPVYLDLDFTKVLTSRRMDAYERLLLDAFQNKLTLFAHKDEQEAAWRWVEPILSYWEQSNISPKIYNPGSWGPVASSALLARYNANWHEEII